MICQSSQLEPCHSRLQLGLVGGGFHQSNHRADRDRQESIVLQGEDEQLVEGVRALPSSKPGLHSSTTQSPHHHHHRPYVRSVSLLLPQSSFLSSWVLVGVGWRRRKPYLDQIAYSFSACNDMEDDSIKEVENVLFCQWHSAAQSPFLSGLHSGATWMVGWERKDQENPPHPGAVVHVSFVTKSWKLISWIDSNDQYNFPSEIIFCSHWQQL